jgi:hypothetical protein
MAGGLIDLLRDGQRRLSEDMAGRIRLENQAYACRPVEEIARNCYGLVDAWIAYLEVGDWTPVEAQTMKVIRQRLPMGFKVSDVIGALTSCEEVITEYIEEEDSAGEMRNTAQHALLRATFHKTRLELVDRFIESSHDESTRLLEEAYRRVAELEGAASAARTAAHRAAESLRDDLLSGLRECSARISGGDSAVERVRSRLEVLISSTDRILQDLEGVS